MVLEVGVEQLVQNIAAAHRQALPHVVPGVFGGNQTADVDKLQKGLGIPLVQLCLIPAALLELRQLFVGVIDQGGKLCAVALGHGVPQHLIHLFPDNAGCGIEDMYKCLILAVKVTHEMLGAFGQLQQCLGADDLACRRCLRGVIPCQQAQIFEVVADLVLFGTHGLLHHNSYYRLCRAKMLPVL